MCELRCVYLRTVFDVVALVEAQVAQVVGWRLLVEFSGFRGERELREAVRQ